MLSAFNDEYSADDSTNCTFSINFLAKENVVTPGTNVESFCVISTAQKGALDMIVHYTLHWSLSLHVLQFVNETNEWWRLRM